MSAPAHPWVAQYQDVWQLRSANQGLPKWLRVVALAFGNHRANGHAPFPPGAIADALGSMDQETGELRPDTNVSKWIAAAVDGGFLGQSSTVRCLIVPGHTFHSAPGNFAEPCPWHHGRRRQRAKPLPQVGESLAIP